MSGYNRLAATIGVLACLAAGAARAQQEFPPPQGGTAPVVVVASGMSGPEHYTTVSREIAKMGYDVVLFDGNAMEGTHGAGVKSAILQAQQMPHARPGKVALVGFSLGGGMALYYGTQLPDLVVGAVLWYPATTFIKDVPGFVGRLQMPVLMFAGEADTFRGCCLIGNARTLAAAAAAGGKQFELVTYPGANHDFVKDGMYYNPSAYDDALRRTAARLKDYLGE
jgi:dienelactone hydrolase